MNLEIAEVRCLHCQEKLTREGMSDAFFGCRGTSENPHPVYLLSSSYIKREEIISVLKTPKSLDSSGKG